ncbi:MAG: FHA domain-containing protein [Rhodocyclaceae bacterium]|nr:FHA domain-containing protein [Rhodocyclaceae bacterium]
MAKLILSMDNMVLREIPLTKERTTIGRRPSNDIQIDNLAISGEHAVIITILNDSFLEDLNSTNGTFVNGQRISKHFLQNGDVIELGKYRLRYVKEGETQTPHQGDIEKTMVLRPDELRRVIHDTPSALTRSAPPRTSLTASQPPRTEPLPEARPMTSRPAEQTPAASPPPAAPSTPSPSQEPPLAPLAAIQVLNGASAGKTLDLVKPLTTLGKPGVQVVVIARRPQGYFLSHVEGQKAPLVNGLPLQGQAHLLKDHDIIDLAGVKMEFFYRP